ncbi:MAG: hypothetical protein GKS02_12570 [Alphaproteobacteria bacterium]|nr:hypothetical protein [Alphaproteobacteria bacterium]
MIEIVIEKSTDAEGEATYQWTVWDNDQQMVISTGRRNTLSWKQRWSDWIWVKGIVQV